MSMLATPREVWDVLKATCRQWIAGRSTRRGAALAYYTVFSLAPILMLAIAIAGLFFGQDAARGEIVTQIGDLIGADGARAVQALIENAAKPGAGVTAVLIGFGTLLVGATSALAELKEDLDEIWEAPAAKVSGFWYFVRKRLLSIGLILALGFLLLVSLGLSAILAGLGRAFSPQGGSTVVLAGLEGLNFLFSFVLVSALFAMIYKILPAVHIAWRDVVTGALVTALLFNIGKLLIGMYLGNSAIASSYGAAGSLILILVWVYYSAQIFLFGAEFTKAYAFRIGSRRPSLQV